MQIVSDPRQVRALCDAQRAAGQRVGFVPTMGFLHDGHVSLIERTRGEADFVVVSIFVNPTQFGPNEDLERYPRDLEGDARRCSEAGCGLLFYPSVEGLYPPQYQTHVEVERLTAGACGDRRPGHFRGVCTVVSKLFNIIGPCVAVFGKKDYQQLKVVERLVIDLDFPVQVVGAPTVREPDGLALSSRNAYLSPAQRKRATCLRRALLLAQKRVLDADSAAVPSSELLALVRQQIAAAGDDEVEIRIDYVEIRHRQTLEEVAQVVENSSVILAAVFVGKTRLIDNIEL